MRKYLVLIFFLYFVNSSGQTFLNGDFEINTAIGCDYNNVDTVFNTKISNVFAFGKAFNGAGNYGEADIQTNGCFVAPHHGNWCVGLSSSLGPPVDAVAIELSSNLQVGGSYQLSFYVYGNLSFGFNTISNIEIGGSLNNTTFGNSLLIATPDTSKWKHIVFNFTSAQKYKFITVRNIKEQPGWNQIDNFTFTNFTGVHENSTEDIKIFPNPFRSSTKLELRNYLTKGTLLLYNSLGQVVRQMNSINGQTFTLERDNLPNGVYFLFILNDGEKALSTRILIADN